MSMKKLDQPAQISDTYRPIVLAFLRQHLEHNTQTLQNHFGIKLEQSDQPADDNEYLRMPIAASCANFALVAAGQTRGLKRAEIRDQVEDLLYYLFSIPGAAKYEMPATFWLSDFGSMVLPAMMWGMNEELITVTEAVELTGKPHDYFTHAVQRGKLSTYPDKNEPNPIRRSRLLKSQVLALLKQ